MSPAPARPSASVSNRPRRSLSGRLLWLTVAIVLLTEILVFVPGLARERRAWFTDRMTQAHIAALSVAASPDGMVDIATRDELLRLSGTVEIRLHEPGREMLALRAEPEVAPSVILDLRQENAIEGMQRAIATLFSNRDRLILVTADSPFRPGTVIDLVIHEKSLVHALRDFARNSLGLAILVACVSGAFVYLVVLFQLVMPIRRIIESISAFRADPERTAPLDPDRITVLPDGEMAMAGRELAAMQNELRAALWRNARLAALGTAMAKVSHDLRNILAPALLTAERLQANPDAAIRRSGATLVRAVDRATELVSRTLDFAREGPPPLSLSPVDLGRLVDEAAEAVPNGENCHLDNRIGAATEISADHDQLLRVFSNLLRNAAEAGARHIRVAIAEPPSQGSIAIEIADDGPGLPEGVQAKLFRPFAGAGKRGGTGLGLAIARDLMRAHGGDIVLASTGPKGTVFRLILPGVLPVKSERPAGSAHQNAGDAPAAIGG